MKATIIGLALTAIIAALAISGYVNEEPELTWEQLQAEKALSLYERLDGQKLTRDNIRYWTMCTCAENPQMNEYSLTINVPEMELYDVIIPISLADYMNVNNLIDCGATYTLHYRQNHNDFICSVELQ